MVRFDAAFWQTNEGPWIAKIIGVSGEFDVSYWNMIRLTTVMATNPEDLDYKLRIAITRKLDLVGDMVHLNLRYLTNLNPKMLSDDTEYTEEVIL